MDRGAWRAIVHSVAKNRPRLKRLSKHARFYGLMLLREILDVEIL